MPHHRNKKINALRKECKLQGLATFGTKAELIDRLEENENKTVFVSYDFEPTKMSSPTHVASCSSPSTQNLKSQSTSDNVSLPQHASQQTTSYNLIYTTRPMNTTAAQMPNHTNEYTHTYANQAGANQHYTIGCLQDVRNLYETQTQKEYLRTNVSMPLNERAHTIRNTSTQPYYATAVGNNLVTTQPSTYIISTQQHISGCNDLQPHVFQNKTFLENNLVTTQPSTCIVSTQQSTHDCNDMQSQIFKNSAAFKNNCVSTQPSANVNSMQYSRNGCYVQQTHQQATNTAENMFSTQRHDDHRLLNNNFGQHNNNVYSQQNQPLMNNQLLYCNAQPNSQQRLPNEI